MANNSINLGSFSIPTAFTPGQILTVSGVGFTPAAVIIWGGNSTSTASGISPGNTSFVFGIATASGSRFNVGHLYEDGTTSEPMVGWNRSDSIFYLYTYWNGLNGIADFDGMTSDGFKFVIADQFSTASRIHYLAIKNTIASGGVYLGYSALPTTQYQRVDKDITTGFQPDGVIVVRGMLTSDPATNNNYGDMSIGFVTNPYVNQYEVAGGTHHGGTALNSALTYAVSGEIASSTDSYYSRRVMKDTVSFKEWLPSGLRLSHYTLGEYDDANYIYYLALKGPNFHPGMFMTRTDTENIVVSGVGFKPAAVLFISNNQFQSRNTLVSGFFSDDRLSVGAATETQRRVYAYSSEDWTVPTEEMMGINHEAVYLFLADNVLKGQMDLVSMDNDGFTVAMDIPDPHPSFVTYLAIGDSPKSSSIHAYVCGSGYVAVPYADDYRDSWINQNDGYTLYPNLADSDDTTYAWFDNALTGDYFEVRLERLFGTKSGVHILSWKAKRKAGATSVTLKCELRQGSTVITSDTQTVADDVVHEFNKQLTAGEISSITDYSELRIRVTIIAATF